MVSLFMMVGMHRDKCWHWYCSVHIHAPFFSSGTVQQAVCLQIVWWQLECWNYTKKKSVREQATCLTPFFYHDDDDDDDDEKSVISLIL